LKLLMTGFAPKPKFFIVVYVLAMSICNLVALPLQDLSHLRNGYQDFTIYYTSALLLRHGQASDLYNPVTQYQAQLRFTQVPLRQGPLPYNHPAFEALLFLPFTLLEYWPAYLLWTALNLIMLAVIVTTLKRQFPQLAAVPTVVLVLGSTAFFPVSFALFEGQDLILLLFLFVMALICLDRGHDAATGALLAGGLFRPHLIVPMVILLAVRRWRVLLGFAPVAAVVTAISVAIVGWRGSLDFVRFVLRVEETVCPGCFGPQTVPNLRGLIQNLPGLSASSRWATLLILAWSIVVFLLALRRIRNGRDSISFSFSLATVTTLLISFHALLYDLSLLLPMVLFLLSRALGIEGRKIGTGTILVILLSLTPLYVFLSFAMNRFFWFSLILLWLYLRLVRTPAPAEVPA